MKTLDRYGCPYKYAIDFLIKNGNKLEENSNNYGRQVVKIAIEALEKQIKIKKEGEINEKGIY